LKLEDGGGSGRVAKVNGRQEVKTFSIIETETEAANDLGLTYNLNSGEVTSIASGAATLIYFKNDEDSTYVINAVALGARGFTGLADMIVATIYRNPDAGDLISDATAADISSNSNFGSSNQLGVGTLLYKGKNAGTISGGEEFAIIYVGNNSRAAPPLNIELPKGGSIAVKIEGASATAGNAYCALIGHLKDSVRQSE
jgi:hypothetical protein